jgi:hypothetical protein
MVAIEWQIAISLCSYGLMKMLSLKFYGIEKRAKILVFFFLEGYCFFIFTRF